MTNTVEPPLPPGVSRERVRLGAEHVAMLRAGGGRPLVFLHGSGGAGFWMPIHDRLAEHFDVIAPDHPGFGGSDAFPALEDVQDLAFHYADLIKTLGLGSPIIVGTSFGGWIAAELAAYHPDVVGRLVLVDAIGLYIDGHPIGDLFAMSPPNKIAALFANPAVAEGLFPADPDVDTIIALAREEASFARFAWSPFCHDPRLPRLLPRITATTLVVWGESDALVPLAHGEAYSNLIPDSRLVVLPGTGHAPAIEGPHALAARIVEFAA